MTCEEYSHELLNDNFKGNPKLIKCQRHHGFKAFVLFRSMGTKHLSPGSIS